ncbi:MAG: anaerobic ribonucleoside-triphosphate reductase, partial [Thermoproteota archaeon]
YSSIKEMRCALSQTPSLEASRRMATLDVERYGLSNVCVSGGRDKPYYSDLNSALSGANLSLNEYLRIHERIHHYFLGSNLVKIPVEKSSSDELFSITKRIIGKFKIPIYTFDISLTYCSNCRKTFHGVQVKCPSCGSTSSLSKFIREGTRYTIATY